MMKFNEEYEGVSLSVAMEREEELTCDIRLYEEQLLRLQLKLQKKSIDIDEYTNDYDIISSKLTGVKEKLQRLSREINSRIQDYDSEDNLDEIDTEEFVENYYAEIGEDGWENLYD